MAETVGAGLAVAPEDRGTLEVRVQALQHLAERAAMETPGTVAHRSGVRGLIGAGAPHAQVTTAGPSVRVVLDIAATWPADVARIAAEAREHVLRRAGELSGVGVTTVDVTVHLVAADEAAPVPRRLR